MAIKRGQYACGCALVEKPEHSNTNWQAFEPKCPTHGESIDWASLFPKSRQSTRPDEAR